jgi:cytochrome c biogenesis protein ResB
VIRSAWRRLVRFLGSAGLAIWLLVIVGVWSMVATLIPQGAATDREVTVWASAHPLVEPVVRAIGLHQAFTSLLFTVCVLALGVCTALCAWKRTKAAMDKAGTLRRAAVADERSLTARHDLEIACDPALSGAEVLSIASETLKHLGIKTKRRKDLLTAVSSPWSVWGSAVFHWALLALILALIVGNLLRSEGLMGVAVGQTKADAPVSYGELHAGPMRDWSRVHRSIRVDAFDPHFRTGGIDRGPTPTVSVLDGVGKVIKTQRVYPNMTLKTGSLTIYPSDWGLSATLSLVNTSGVETARSVQLVDFSEEATDGTVPVGSVNVSDSAGNALLRVSVSVPLDHSGDKLLKGIPKKPAALVVVTSPDDKPVLDRIVSPGEGVTLPSGDTLRLDSIGYYARLSVVDDWSIPLLYAGLVIAIIGLTIAVAARQQIVLATVIEGPDGAKLAATMRLWRNASSSRSEIERELGQALSRVEEGSTT